MSYELGDLPIRLHVDKALLSPEMRSYTPRFYDMSRHVEGPKKSFLSWLYEHLPKVDHK